MEVGEGMVSQGLSAWGDHVGVIGGGVM